MNIDPATLGWIGMAIAILVSFVLLTGMAVNSVLRLGKARRAKSDSRIGLYIVIGGFAMLLAHCSRALLEGEVWYRQLIPVSWGNSGLTISNSQSIEAYSFIALGLFVRWSMRKLNEFEDSKRRD